MASHLLAGSLWSDFKRYAGAVPVQKEPALSALRSVLEEVKKYLGGPGGKLSEADTRAFFIDPLVTALGYTGFAEVAREVFIKDTKDFLDYVLRVQGEPRVGVEAKAIDHGLTDGDAGQLIQYCSVVGIEWAVLSNARQWWLYHQFAQAPLQGKLVFKLDLASWNTDAEFSALASQLLLVSKQAFTDSNGPAKWINAQKLDSVLREALTNPQSVEARFLQGQLEKSGVSATTEEIAAWAKAKLAEPLPALPIQSWAATSTSTETVPGKAPKATDINSGMSFWLSPAGASKGLAPLESLRCWLNSGKWGFWENTPNRSSVKPGDRIAFYANKKGVAAWATVAAAANLLVTPDEWPEPSPQDRPVYKLPLQDIHWLPTPREINVDLRKQLDAYQGKKVDGNWSWFVQATHAVTGADFERLIGTKTG